MGKFCLVRHFLRIKIFDVERRINPVLTTTKYRISINEF
jgi:hypothetical protein